MPTRRPFIGGNWKMNTDLASAVELARGVAGAVENAGGAEVAVFPPFPYMLAVGSVLRDRGTSVRLGAQDVSDHPNGAFTGEVSAPMLQDCGVQWVLTGHSERRHVIGESDELVGRKTAAVLDRGLGAVLCIGETLEQREAGETDAVNQRQLRAGLTDRTADDLDRLVIAYEPVWAIGTGRAATPEDAQSAHLAIRTEIGSLFGPAAAESARIIYGGSMKPANAAELLGQPDIDGGLIGGASLDAAGFGAIVNASASASPA